MLQQHLGKLGEEKSINFLDETLLVSYPLADFTFLEILYDDQVRSSGFEMIVLQAFLQHEQIDCEERKAKSIDLKEFLGIANDRRGE